MCHCVAISNERMYLGKTRYVDAQHTRRHDMMVYQAAVNCFEMQNIAEIIKAAKFRNWACAGIGTAADMPALIASGASSSD